MLVLLLLLAIHGVSSHTACPDGSIYNSDFNSCYKVISAAVGYLTAENRCIFEGGHLVSIHSEEENNFIKDLVLSSGNPDYFGYYIGAIEDNTSTWQWTDGSSFNYTNWAYPYDTLNGCTALIPIVGASWVWVFRESTFYCDSEWTYFEETDSCYKGFFHANWTHAEDTCRSYDSHLASIHSDKENQFIFDLVTKGEKLPNGRTAQTWFGLIHADGQWVYTDGTQCDYSRWADGELYFTENQGCVVLTTDLRYVYDKSRRKLINYTTYWADANCDEEQRRFVCKKLANH